MQPHLQALVDSKFAPLWLDQQARPDPFPALLVFNVSACNLSPKMFLLSAFSRVIVVLTIPSPSELPPSFLAGFFLPQFY